jgi:hypothetical protein
MSRTEKLVVGDEEFHQLLVLLQSQQTTPQQALDAVLRCHDVDFRHLFHPPRLSFRLTPPA